MKLLTNMRVVVLILFLFLLLTGNEGSSASSQFIQLVPADFGKCQQPQVKISIHGEVDVVFGKEDSVCFVRSTNAATTFSEPAVIGILPRLALGMRRGPRIAGNGSNIVVAAISHADGNLYAWQSANGKMWSAKNRINDSPGSAGEGLHGLAANGRGNCFAVWLDSRNRQAEVWGASSKDSGRTWEKNRRIYKSPDGHVCECCHPSVIFSGENEIAVMWRNWLHGSRDMYLAISRDGGETFGEGIKAGGGTWLLNACPMDGGSLAASAGGEIFSVWRSEDFIFGVKSGSPKKLIANGTQPVATVRGQHAYCAWQQNEKLLLQTFPPTGSPKIIAERGRYPSIDSSTAGTFIVWESPEPALLGRWIE